VKFHKMPDTRISKCGRFKEIFTRGGGRLGTKVKRAGKKIMGKFEKNGGRKRTQYEKIPLKETRTLRNEKEKNYMKRSTLGTAVKVESRQRKAIRGPSATIAKGIRERAPKKPYEKEKQKGEGKPATGD